MVVRIKEGGTGQVTAPGARIALGLSDQEIIDIVTPSFGGPYQPLDSDLTAIAALTTTSYGRAFLELANAGAARTYLSLGTMATETASNYLTTAAAASSYQPLDSDLTAIAALSTTSYGRSLLILADAAAARTALALGTMATETATTYLTTATAAATYETITNVALKAPLASPTFTGLVTTAGQIAFPATQNPSAGANVLDDYEEGTWTPSITFSTPGNLSVTYAVRIGVYQKVGDYVTILFDIQTSTFTHTTASGQLQLTGLPFTAAASPVQGCGSVSFQGVTVGTYIEFGPRVVGGTAIIDFIISASAAARALLDSTHLPTGTNKLFSGQVTYKV